MEKFINSFNKFVVQRRFSKIPEPYPTNEIYNDYKSAKKYEITLNPGDSLFIPAGWFHFVISEKVDQNNNLNIAVSYFTQYDNCLDCQNFDSKHFNNLTIPILNDKVDYNHYKKNSNPFVMKNNKNLFNVEQLKNILNNKELIVTKSNNKLFASNYIKEHFPESCQEFTTTFDNFLRHGKKENYYLIQSELIPNIKKLISIPNFLINEIYANFSLWINFGGIYSSLHYDLHNNILSQICGTKKILLFPPSERNKMHLINDFDPKFLCQLQKVVFNKNNNIDNTNY